MSGNKEYKKCACKLTHTLPDGRIAFLYGKVYKCKKDDDEMKVFGEGGCVCWFKEKFHTHFEMISDEQ